MEPEQVVRPPGNSTPAVQAVTSLVGLIVGDGAALPGTDDGRSSLAIGRQPGIGPGRDRRRVPSR
jgi:hypothetical protein